MKTINKLLLISFKGLALFILSLGLLGLAASASPAIVIDTVYVGDAGNANDSTGYGGVGYGYHIGAYEVTNSQYVAFLNDVAAADMHNLYNTEMGSSSYGGINRAGAYGRYTYSVKSGFGNKPVNFVGFWDAARFTNWLTTGDTETGVYNLGRLTNPAGNTISRDATAWANGGVAIANENEWYKAAYYQPEGAGGDADNYWLYPTTSNTVPTGAEENYNANDGNEPDDLADVGYSLPSYYGTYDQGGNVMEWNDAIVSTISRKARGSSFDSAFTMNLQSSNTNSGDLHPTNEGYYLGFRVSSLTPIPEPSTYAAILGCFGLMLALMRRKGCRTL